jgi:hypothetical protein
MKRWMKWAAIATVGLVSVPVMGLTILPSKTAAKPAVAPVKVTKVNHVTPAKRTVTTAKPVTKSLSPRPASVRLGKNVTPAKTVSPVNHSKVVTKTKPTVASKTPIKPTTLHSGPGKLPAPKSTLSKAMAHTHTTMN